MTNSDAWQDLRDAVQTAWPASRFRDLGVVVGCSGGADSVALLRCLVEAVRWQSEVPVATGFIIVAHFNHQFRGRHSQADEDFVRALADQLGVPVEVEHGNASRRDEDSARNDRRQFFRDVIRRRGARYLALGHSLDDNVETVLHRLMRGTGPAGMAGILPFRPLSDDSSERDFVLARPLLNVRREPIRDALRSRGFRWREDGSNLSNDFCRNWIRNELLPMVQSQFPDAVPAIGRAIDGQHQWLGLVQRTVDRWLEIVLIQPQPLTLRRIDHLSANGPSSLDADLTISPAVTIEALRTLWQRSGWPLRDMGQFHWKRVVEILSGQGPDAFTLPGAINVQRHSDSVTFHRD